jgi:hypothetical protein
LSRWNDHLRAAGFEQLDRGEADRRTHHVDEASDEKTDAHDGQ